MQVRDLIGRRPIGNDNKVENEVDYRVLCRSRFLFLVELLVFTAGA